MLAVVVVGAPQTARAGVYPIGNGETVRASSATYDREVVESAVQFLASLPHGREMSKVRVYVATPSEVSSICGGDADACYVEQADRIVVPPEFNDGSTTAETIAHEYGHHLVAARPGGAFGTPRWDIYEHVCELIQRGILLPYNLGNGYWDNPEEAFAQSYAALAVPEVAEEWAFTSWLEPTAGALARIRLDIEHPWPKRYAEARLRRSCHGGYDPYPNY